jgi:hypothetical protein
MYKFGLSPRGKKKERVKYKQGTVENISIQQKGTGEKL